MRSEESTHIFRRLFFGSSFISVIVPFIGLAYAYLWLDDDIVESYMSSYRLYFILLIIYSTVIAKGTDLITWTDIAKYYFRSQIRKQRRLNMTQMEAHKYFQGCQIGFPSKYSFLLKNTLSILFFSLLIPLVSFIGCVGMILGYWTDKFILLRLSRIPVQLNEVIARNCLIIFLIAQYILILFRFIILVLSDSDKKYTDICTNLKGSICKQTMIVESSVLLVASVCLLFWIYAGNKYLRIHKPHREELEKVRQANSEIKFDEARPFFVFDYERLHPFSNQVPTASDSSFMNLPNIRPMNELETDQAHIAVYSEMVSRVESMQEDKKSQSGTPNHEAEGSPTNFLSDSMRFLGSFGSQEKIKI